jgi:hypothetical protein
VRNHRLVSALEWSAMPSRLIDDERDEVSLFRGWWGSESGVLRAFPVDIANIVDTVDTLGY